MNVSWKTGAGRSLIFSVLFFACAGAGIYDAKRYASAAPGERTATAHDISVEHHIFRYLRFNFYSCSYNFSVDGSLHIGLGGCPETIVDDAVNGRYSDSAWASTGANVTVYYDPADPSVNSLLEFSAASENEYRAAMPWIALGVLTILSIVFFAVLAANENKRAGGIVVDTEGTVIYPEEIDCGAGSVGPPGWSGQAQESSTATNNEAAKAGSVAPSPGLRELYLDVVNKIHPDRASNESDRALRERLMKEANAAFEHGDAETLRRVLEEYKGAITDF